MAKLVRKTFIQFGAQGPTSDFGEFGSKAAGTPVTSQDPAVIQSEGAWQTGWQDAINTIDKAPYLEDMNGLHFVFSYMTAYLFQMGIPEWDSATTYFKNSVVQDNQGLGQWFVSLTDNNLNQQPPAGASNAQWNWINAPTILDGGVTVNAIPKVSAAGPGKLVDSAISDDGTNVILAEPLKFPDGSVQTKAAGALSPHFGTITVNGGPGGTGTFTCGINDFVPPLPAGTTVIPFVTVANTGGGNSGVSGSWQTGTLTGTGTLIGPGINGAWQNVGINSGISFAVGGNGGGSQATWVITAWI
jgi:hypothetical protein